MRRCGRRHWLLPVGVLAISLIAAWILTGTTEVRYPTQRAPGPRREVLHGNVQLRRYVSSQDSTLHLWALIRLPSKPTPIMVTSHGWHGELSSPGWFERYCEPREEFLTVQVEMRGRGSSGGKPDVSGWELQDWIDAVNFARKEYAAYISDPSCVYAEGGSGSGGNVYALVGKFPDFFTAAVVHFGMSDYAMLCRQDEQHEFRDEIEDDKWIEGNVASNPEGYSSRGGITTVRNLLTPLHIDHGETDIRVPVGQAREYVAAALALRKEVRYVEWPSVGDRRHVTGMSRAMVTFLNESVRDWLKHHRKPPVLPPSGQLVVGGYVKTRSFEVTLEHVDRMGSVEYELDANGRPLRIEVGAPTSKRVSVRALHPGLAAPAEVRCSAPCDVSRDSTNQWTNAVAHGDAAHVEFLFRYPDR